MYITMEKRIEMFTDIAILMVGLNKVQEKSPIV